MTMNLTYIKSIDIVTHRKLIVTPIDSRVMTYFVDGPSGELG